MLHKTRAIVLHKTNYSETSIVVQVYSLDYGKISLLVRGVKKKKSRHKSALFEPLSIIEFVGNFKNYDKLITPHEIKLFVPFIQIQSKISKRLIALFLAELIHKSIREPHPERDLYLFIENSLQILEHSVKNVANFHIVFLMELSRYLGFYPMKSVGNYFNMLEGYFTDSIPESNIYLQGAQKDLFLQVLGTKVDNSEILNFNVQQRKDVLTSVIQYYKVHIAGMGEIKSQEILETILR